ncbi:MAG: MBL fold/beta-CASP domain-containing RNA metallo-hydrolase [Clostridium sp.]|jgi:RNA-metabolizing metallo-beta-lactamase|nr:MBL fold/beta-CASP domain-containing RNA metallo-hydrolase [Clostridium sp.]CDE54338.1 putative exonuclease of the beta-lactamase fold involved in RNA processing [Clostridium sp. CAG:269]
MKITFLGATKIVTGSNFLVEAAGKKFLVDCGLYQGKAELEEQNYREFDYNPAEIDFMLLTHAHIDHSGRIPKLYNDGFKGPIYAHKATCDLCQIMLPDSGHIQEMEAEWKNKKRIRKGQQTRGPLYTAEDALKCMEIFVPVKYDEIIQVSENIYVRFNDAGHMLGSSTIEIWAKEDGKETKAVFSGDLGNNDIPLLSEPTMIDNCDYLVMESTYGSRLHIRNDQKAELFLKIVSETIDNGGTVVIPSFAVGRTQEILYEINKIKENRHDEEFLREYRTLMKVPVYVDSPLAISATQVFKENMDLFEDEVKEEMERGNNPLEFPGLKFTQTADESKALNESNEPSIIISASGMCDVGRIKHHLKHNIWNPKSTILFVGYQAPGTLGYEIVNGAKKVTIFGEEFAVNARIEYIEGYSGHADQEWLMNFVYSFYNKPKHIFLVHGEEESQEVLRNKILENTGIGVTIPEYGETYQLDDELRIVNRIKIKKTLTLKNEVLERLEKLKDELADMEVMVKEDMTDDELRDEDIFRINEKIKDLEQQILNVVEG